MTSAPDIDSLTAELHEALELLADYAGSDGRTISPEPLPSLLDECKAICDGFAQPAPYRSIHHLACTGGTLISKCIAALPNVVLLSEIDPISPKELRQNFATGFAPTDILLGLHRASHRVAPEVMIEVFKSAIATAQNALSMRGAILVLRDHAHGQFCTVVDHDKRPTLHDMLADCGPQRAVVTVRHPLESFAALFAKQGQWHLFEPFDLGSYARRYLAFLDRHQGMPMIRYEDFVENPQGTLEEICHILDLPYSLLALDLIGAVQLSGDSGRSGSTIEQRPRRDIPPEIDKDRAEADYVTLCSQLGYDP
ncbi:MAG: sulfotransferase [Cypionkella sp.]|jgi:hypothetical protein|nr:sulfotransferase [Cypionkella sp.]